MLSIAPPPTRRAIEPRKRPSVSRSGNLGSVIPQSTSIPAADIAKSSSWKRSSVSSSVADMVGIRFDEEKGSAASRVESEPEGSIPKRQLSKRRMRGAKLLI